MKDLWRQLFKVESWKGHNGMTTATPEACRESCGHMHASNARRVVGRWEQVGRQIGKQIGR